MEKKFTLSAIRKINILILVLSDKKILNKKILNETKNHNPPPPPFKLNGRSLMHCSWRCNILCSKHDIDMLVVHASTLNKTYLFIYLLCE